MLVKQAVNETRGQATFHFPRVFSGLGSLRPRSDVGVRQLRYDTVTVDTVRLDDFADENDIAIITLLKLDIEGHEVFALRGAERLLAAGRIRALTFEFGSANINSRTFFRDFGICSTGTATGSIVCCRAAGWFACGTIRRGSNIFGVRPTMSPTRRSAERVNPADIGAGRSSHRGGPAAGTWISTRVRKCEARDRSTAA